MDTSDCLPKFLVIDYKLYAILFRIDHFIFPRVIKCLVFNEPSVIKGAITMSIYSALLFGYCIEADT